MTWNYRPPTGGGKRDKERARLERREIKAAKKELRKAEKSGPPEQFDNGTFPIEELPDDAKGVFRVLSRRTGFE